MYFSCFYTGFNSYSLFYLHLLQNGNGLSDIQDVRDHLEHDNVDLAKINLMLEILSQKKMQLESVSITLMHTYD